MLIDRLQTCMMENDLEEKLLFQHISKFQVQNTELLVQDPRNEQSNEKINSEGNLFYTHFFHIL